VLSTLGLEEMGQRFYAGQAAQLDPVTTTE
jgi:hypothetical protein